MSVKRRNKLIMVGLVLIVMAAVTIRFKIAYHYSHVPFRSAIVPRPYPQMGQSVAGIAFSPNGKLLAVADTQAGFSFWLIPQLRCDRRFGESPFSDQIFAMLWTSDDKAIIAGDGQAVNGWNYRSGGFIHPSPQPTFTKAIPGKPFYKAQYGYHIVSPSAKLAAGANPEGDVVVWDVKTNRSLFNLKALPASREGYPIHFCDIAFSPDDRLVATASVFENDSFGPAPLDIVLRDSQTGHIIRKWQWKEANLSEFDDSSGGNLGNTGLAFSPDGLLLVTANDDKVAVWDIETGSLQHILSTEVSNQWGGAKKLVFFRQEHLLAGAGWGESIPVWNVETGALLQIFHAAPYVDALAVSPDSRLLATGGQGGDGDGILQLWDVSRLKN